MIKVLILLLVYYNNLVKAQDYNNDEKIGFIHIGKCAGTTAAMMIRKACYRHVKTEECTEHYVRNETEISKKVDEYFHMRQVDLQKYEKFIVTIRDPVDRVISWFIYQHPTNQIYENRNEAKQLWDCYNTLEEFGLWGLQEIPDNLEQMSPRDRQCMHLARDAIFAKTPDYVFPHLYYNYQFYVDSLLKVNPPKIIYALRQEAFWDDWQNINSLLGGGEITKTKSFMHTASRSSINRTEATDDFIPLNYNNRTLSPLALKNMCEILCSEIMIYKSIIKKAVNLDSGAKLKSLHALSQKCPEQVKQAQCRTSARSIGFISVGKTGGSSAALLLKKGCFTAGCQSRIIENESEVSRQVTHLYHLRQVPAHLHSSFIVSVRDPIDRVLAWFIYQHPKNRIYPTHPHAMKLFLCYQSLQELAVEGLRQVSPHEQLNSNDRECISLAKNAIMGKAPPYYYPHLTYNYQYYVRELLEQFTEEEKEIFVLRFEYFWNDFQSINTQLGGGILVKPTRLYNITVVLPPESTLMKKDLKVRDVTIGQGGLMNLCITLCQEIMVYKMLLFRAKNLSVDEKKESYRRLYERCPYQASSNACA